MNVLYCPLRFYIQSADLGAQAKECLKSSCAWWDKVKNKCAVLSIAHNIFDIPARIEE